jgi:hypothetical protein
MQTIHGESFVMSCRISKLAILIFLQLCTPAANALPFNFQEPRSMSMGGTGVAVADAATAPLFNPAMLSLARYSDDFSLTLPTVGVFVKDPGDLRGSVDKFQAGNYVDSLQTAVSNLDAAINTANSTPNAGTMAAVGSNATIVANSLNTLSVQLDTLNNKPVSFDAGLSTVIGIPNKKFGLAFFANGSIVSGGAFQYKDASLIAALSAQASCLATAAGNNDIAAINSCGTPIFNSNTLQSSVDFRGVMLNEIGMSFSREFYINRRRVAFGISPKIIQAQLFDIPLGLNSPSLSDFNTSDYRATYSLPNFDLGVGVNFRDGWRSGLVVKNVIPYFLDFKRAPVAGQTPVATGEKLRLIPQTRVGISHTNRWSTVALDADVYRNDPVGLDNYTQYIALGGELNGWNWGQLRAGWRVDLVNSARNIISLGVGFSPFGVHIDMAVAGNEHEIGTAFQLGFRF